LSNRTVMFQVMARVTHTIGTQKCRKFTDLVDFNQTNGVITATLSGVYCAVRAAPTRDSYITFDRIHWGAMPC
jgi:hypothetical protein